MYIIKPKYKIITDIDGSEVLKLIERCGRVCYKSENKITDDSAEMFVSKIMNLRHESVLEHYNITVHFICNRGFSHEMVRHRLASYCIAGDTKILRYNQNKDHLTIEDLYKRQQDSQLNGRNKLMTLRSIDDNNIIIPNKFKKIIKSGLKDVYEVTTSLGYKIKTTKDHIFFTPTGEKQLKSLQINSKVLVNGIEMCHKLIHKGMNVKKATIDHITSIEYVGKEETYDIEMDAPFHNFVANGFIVHNSQESTRYCNYKDQLTVIDPVWFKKGSIEWEEWHNMVLQAEHGYRRLLKGGAKPQEARGTLPIDIKTELIVTANLRQWRHILKLRCHSSAHPSMKELMIPLREELKIKIPVVFDDLK